VSRALLDCSRSPVAPGSLSAPRGLELVPKAESLRRPQTHLRTSRYVPAGWGRKLSVT